MPVDAVPDRRFPRAARLRSTADFERVFARRCSAGDELLVIYACENDLALTRLGLSVSRKVGKSVVRNRWKRLLREAFRLSREQLPRGLDLVVVARPQPPPSLERLRKSLVRLAARAGNRVERSRGAGPT
jgi:ribonuclease P protein component